MSFERCLKSTGSTKLQWGKSSFRLRANIRLNVFLFRGCTKQNVWHFHDAGYKGLYGGLGDAAIKTRKAISEKDSFLDRMNAIELAANQFRMTQTRDKLARDRVHNQAKVT